MFGVMLCFVFFSHKMLTFKNFLTQGPKGNITHYNIYIYIHIAFYMLKNSVPYKR